MDEIIKICIEEAKKSIEHDDVPIGAVVVKDGKIIAKAHNTREIDKNITGHAEINAILVAAKALNRWNLADCDLYVTLEPCPMCQEIIKQSRIQNVYYLLSALDYKNTYNKTNFNKIIENDTAQNEQMYADILKAFFKEKR